MAHAFAGAVSLAFVAVVAQVYPMLDRADRFQLTEAEVDDWLAQVQAVYSASSLGALVAFVSLLVWLSRSVDNTPPLGGGIARRGPRWAIGAWFIPFVNIVMPALILRDLARRIHPEAAGRGRLVLVWWLCYWGPSVLGFYVGLLPIHGTDSIREMYAWILATQTIGAMGYFVTLFLVWRLQQDAEHWVARLRPAGWSGYQGGPVPGWPGDGE